MISMTERTKQFIELLSKMEQERPRIFKDLEETMNRLQMKKGMDYGEEQDGLRNLRRRGPAGVVARMGDKLARLESLTREGRTAAVEEESVDDTLIDLANYCLLLIILRRDIEEEKKAQPEGIQWDV